MTALECLTECKIFDEVRDKKKEQGLQIMKDASKNKMLINLDIDSMDAFDYEDADNAKYSVADLKGFLSREIRLIQTKNKADL
jgi:hypothetical protein